MWEENPREWFQWKPTQSGRNCKPNPGSAPRRDSNRGPRGGRRGKIPLRQPDHPNLQLSFQPGDFQTTCLLFLYFMSTFFPGRWVIYLVGYFSLTWKTLWAETGVGVSSVHTLCCIVTGLACAQVHFSLTSMTGVARTACTFKPVQKINTLTTVLAWIRFAFIELHLTVCSCVTCSNK